MIWQPIVGTAPTGSSAYQDSEGVGAVIETVLGRP